MKDTVTRSRENIAGIGKAGGKSIAVYYTQGRYDLVSITEAPDEETAMAFLFSMNKAGNVRTETLRAFSLEEMENIPKKVQ